MRGRTPPRNLGLLILELSSYLRHSLENSPVDFHNDMELADLVLCVPEDCDNRLRIQWRSVGCDAIKLKSAGLKHFLEALEERPDILMGGIVVQNLIHEPSESPIVHNRENTEWAVVKLVCCDVAGEVG